MDHYATELSTGEFGDWLRRLSLDQLFDQMDFEIRDMEDHMDLFNLSRIEQVWFEVRRRMLGVD